MAEYVETLRLVVDTSDLDRALADIQRKMNQTQQSTSSASRSMSTSLGGVETSAQDVSGAMGGIGSAASNAAKVVGNAFGGVGSAISGVGEHIGNTFSNIGTAATVAVGAATAVGVGLAKTGLGYIDLWQKSVASWTTLLGTADQANQMMTDIAAFSSKMPFGRQTWIEATQQLLGYGFAADKVIPTLQAIGDAAAATGKGQEAVDGITRAFAEVQSSGKVTGETLMRLSNYGINAADLIGKEFGKTGAQVKDAIAKGTLSGEKGLEALTRGMTKAYAGAGGNVTKTLSGMTGAVQSRLRDLGTDIVEPFVSRNGGGYIIEWGNKIVEIFTNIHKYLGPIWADVVKSWAPALERFGDLLSKVADNINPENVKKWVDQIGRLGKFLAPLGASLLAMGSSNLSGMLGPFGALLPKINPLLAAVVALGLSIPGAKDAFVELAKAVGDLGMSLWKQLLPHLKDLGDWLGPKLNEAMNWVITIGFPKLLEIIAHVTEFLEQKAIPALMDLKEWLWPKLQAAFDWLTKTAWPKVQEVMTNVTTFINEKVLPALSDLKEWLWPKLVDAFHWLTETAWPKVQEVMGTVSTFINEKVLPALSDLQEWLWPKLQSAYDWFNAAWPQLQQAMSDVMAFIETEVVPKLAAISDWLWPNVEAAFTWVAETAWPNVLKAMTTVIDYIKQEAIPNLQLMGQTLIDAMSNPRGEGNVAAPDSFLDDLHAIFDNLQASLEPWQRTGAAIADIWKMLMPSEGLASDFSLIGSTLSTLLDPLREASQGWLDLSNGIAAATEKLRDFIKFLKDNNVSAESIKSAISNPLTAPATLGAGLIQGKTTGQPSGNVGEQIAEGFATGVEMTNLNPTQPTATNVLANTFATPTPELAAAATVPVVVEDTATALAASTAPIAAAGEDTGTAFTEGVSTGLTTGTKPTSDVAKNAMGYVVDSMKVAMGIYSPSKVTQDIGEAMMDGLALGITDNLSQVKYAMAKLDNLLKNSMRDTANAMRKASQGIGETLGGMGSGIGSAVSSAVSGLSGAATENPATGEIADYIRQAAIQRGIDPNVALTVAEHEGGTTEAARRGTFDTGSSWWPFQLHYGGAGYEQYGTVAGMGNSFTQKTGFAPGDPAAWQASVDYALDNVLKSPTGWQNQFYGAQAGGISAFQGLPTRDNGGWLMPGVSTLANWTGQPERILAPGQGGGITVNLGGLTVNAPGGDAASLGDALPAIAEQLAGYIADRLGSSLANQRAVTV